MCKKSDKLGFRVMDRGSVRVSRVRVGLTVSVRTVRTGCRIVWGPVNQFHCLHDRCKLDLHHFDLLQICHITIIRSKSATNKRNGV